MSKNKKIVLAIILGIIIVTIGIRVIANLRPSQEKSDKEKIEEYLENTYNEKFDKIEYLGKEQNVKSVRFFHDVMDLYPIKDSFRYYYKAYSPKKNIAFYVYMNRNEKGNEYFNDTYQGFLERRKQVENVLNKSEELLSDITDESSLIEYDGYEKLECNKDNLYKVMSEVSRKKEVYIKSHYYKDFEGFKDLRIIYKTKLVYKKLVNENLDDLYYIYNSIKNERELYDEGEYAYNTEIEVIIETEDGYSVVIKGDKNYTGTAYFKWIKGEDEKTITFIDAATNPMGEEQKGGKAEYTFAELAEEARLNKYKIVTDEKYKTLSNDGGSHINIYYKVDFSDNTITKYEDKYVGLKGYQYKEKKVYDKKLELSTSEVLKATLDNLLEKKDIKEKDDYSPYVIKSAIKEKNIYNKESIKKLERILEFIENE